MRVAPFETLSIILFWASELAQSEYLKPSPTIVCSSSLRKEPRRSFGAYAKTPSNSPKRGEIKFDDTNIICATRRAWREQSQTAPFLRSVGAQASRARRSLCVTKNNWCNQ